ncbi:MAG: DUF7264 domain-containing protein [Pseudonocardiaceae bacterium]
MGITLGDDPDSLTVHLNRYGGFRTDLIRESGPWAEGTVIELHFRVTEHGDPVIWPTTIDDDTAALRATPEQVSIVLDAGALRVWLMGTQPGSFPEVWAEGQVST